MTYGMSGAMMLGMEIAGILVPASLMPGILALLEYLRGEVRA